MAWSAVEAFKPDPGGPRVLSARAPPVGPRWPPSLHACKHACDAAPLCSSWRLKGTLLGSILSPSTAGAHLTRAVNRGPCSFALYSLPRRLGAPTPAPGLSMGGVQKQTPARLPADAARCDCVTLLVAQQRCFLLCSRSLPTLAQLERPPPPRMSYRSLDAALILHSARLPCSRAEGSGSSDSSVSDPHQVPRCKGFTVQP